MEKLTVATQNVRQKNRGCLEEAEDLWELSDGSTCDRCPVRILMDDDGVNIDVIWKSYYFFKEGHLPYPGSLISQPNQIMDGILWINYLKNKHDNEVSESDK